MKVSVITPCFNAASSIAHTIESFLAQHHGEKEMIVVDGASRDGTQDVVRRYGRDGVRLISEPDRGMYDALNKGFAAFDGDVVGALNADDTFHDRHVLGRIADALTGADIVFGDLNFVVDHASKRIVRRWRGGARPRGGFRTGWMPAHPTFYIRREVADAVGPFDLSLATASDYDFMLRAVELFDHRTVHIDAVLVDMMQGGRSTASLSAHIRHNIEALTSRRKWLNAPLVDQALVRKPARKIGQFLVR
ncbi:MAG: glycosyltransferase family 2 protein [Pseudomonadota bacterium]